MEVIDTKDAAPVAEDKGVQNTLGIVKVVEGLFHAVRLGSYPLGAHQAIEAGMQFLGQFHGQLVKQLPAGVVEKLRAEQGAENGKA